MSAANPHRSLVGTIGDRIARRVGRRVEGLIVFRHGDAVVVRGRSNSYHAWQLVIAECQQAMAGLSPMRLDCVLRVAGAL
jgi:hypothetical protein